MFVEALAGGPRVRREQERTLAGYEHGVQEYLDATPADGDTLDIPVAALEGARRTSSPGICAPTARIGCRRWSRTWSPG